MLNHKNTQRKSVNPKKDVNMSLISNSLTRVFKNVAVTAAACLALVATGATAAGKG